MKSTLHSLDVVYRRRPSARVVVCGCASSAARGVVRRRHAGELRRIVGAAADDDDARRMGEVVEQTLHQGEVPEVVDAERHLHSVGGPLGARHHLNDRHCRRSRAAAAARGCGSPSAKVRTDVSDARSISRTVHRSACPICSTASAPRAVSRTARHDVPGRVAREQRAGAFQSESGAGAGDDRRLLRAVISPPRESGSGPSASGTAAGTSASTSVVSGSRWSARKMPSDSATAIAASSATTRSAFCVRHVGGQQLCDRVAEPRDRRVADPAHHLGDRRDRRCAPATAGGTAAGSRDAAPAGSTTASSCRSTPASAGIAAKIPLRAAFHDRCQHAFLRAEMPVDRARRQAAGLADVADRRRRVSAGRHQLLRRVEDQLAGLLALLLLLRRNSLCKDHYRHKLAHT